MDNQNEEFTIYNEQLVIEAFYTYIGSCGYMLMEIRLNEMENIYYGRYSTLPIYNYNISKYSHVNNF